MSDLAQRHPLILEVQALNAALRDLLAKLPRPSKHAGEVARPRRRRIRPLGTISVPGSGDAQSMDQRGSLPNGTALGNAGNAGPNTQTFEGLPNDNSGGGSGGAW